MPMFYTSPRPLDKVRDARLRLSKPDHYRFAAKTNAIPLLLEEFPMAAAYYPIVFAAGPSPIPAAVVGLCNDSNLYLDAEGRWRNGAYLPAYVRRYPFILMDDPDAQQFVLCIDEASETLGLEGEHPLFEDGEPSQITKGATEFCAALRQQGVATDEFVSALQACRLLTPNDAQIDMQNGTRLKLEGFLIIDPARFDMLPDSLLGEWRRKGWLAAVYAHLLSSHRWSTLVELAKK
jgi:hypothetical protein